jgi:hypothetical protein
MVQRGGGTRGTVTADLASRKARAGVANPLSDSSPSSDLPAPTLTLRRCDGAVMAKRAKWPSHIGPAIFNKRPKPDLPSWDLGLVPGPDKPREEVQEFKRKAEAYFAECDRIKNEYLVREWWRFLGVDNSDDALMKLGELLAIPAFQKGGDPEAKPGRREKSRGALIRQYNAIEELKRSGKAKTDDGAFLLRDPSLKRDKAKLKTRKNELAKIRKMYKQMRNQPIS